MEKGDSGLNILSVGNMTIDSNFLWFILSVIFLAFVIFSLMLVYHWHKFGMRALAVGTAELVFFVGAILLIMGAAASIVLF